MQKSSSQGREALNATTFMLRLTGKRAAWGLQNPVPTALGKKKLVLFLCLQFILLQFADKRNFNYLLTKIRLSPSASSVE